MLYAVGVHPAVVVVERREDVVEVVLVVGRRRKYIAGGVVDVEVAEEGEVGSEVKALPLAVETETALQLGSGAADDGLVVLVDDAVTVEVAELGLAGLGLGTLIVRFVHVVHQDGTADELAVLVELLRYGVEDACTGVVGELVEAIEAVIYIAVDETNLATYLETVVVAGRRVGAAVTELDVRLVAGELVDLHLVGAEVEAGAEGIVLATEDVAVDSELETAVGDLTDVLELLLVAEGGEHVSLVDKV